MASQGSAISSLIYLGTSVIPDRVKEFKEDKYVTLEMGEDFEVTKKPSEVRETTTEGDRRLFKEAVKQQIRASGSYSLSPFCFRADSTLNKVIIQDENGFPKEVLLSEVKVTDQIKISATDWSTVLAVHDHGVGECFLVEMEDGTTIS